MMYQYKQPSRLRHWLDLVRDVPLLLTEGHADCTERLLDVDPTWTWEPASFEADGQPCLVRDANGQPVGLWIKLTVCGVTRYGYGSLPAAKPEGVKELIGDAIRNAAMRFGVALDLWKKEDANRSGVGTEMPATAPAAAPTPAPAAKPMPAPLSQAAAGSAAPNGTRGLLKAKLTAMGKEKAEAFMASQNRADRQPGWLDALTQAEVAQLLAAAKSE